MPRFYLPQFLIPGQTYDLPPDILQHIKVLRLHPNESIALFDGEGNEWHASLIQQDKRSASVKILESLPTHTESPLKIHIAQGIARGEKMDFILQKATELGATALTPLTTQFCTVKIHSDRKAHKQDHWQKIIISASEQCGRATLMSLQAPQSLSDFLNLVGQRSDSPSLLKLILHPKDPEITLKTLPASLTHLILLIGPEGGLSPHELTLAEHAGFLRLSLGPRVLRTETAALAAISALQGVRGDF